MIIGKRFKFEAAHHLPEYEGKCASVHGHTYVLEVEVWGQVLGNGMVMDLNTLTKCINEVINLYDHKDLNEMFDNPTVEIMVRRIKDIIETQLPPEVKIESIKLQEGEGGWARV
jgi:6-pyruvoyltetrahydropterin/6-carboxytetrahydropterin synthase